MRRTFSGLMEYNAANRYNLILRSSCLEESLYQVSISQFAG